ncbi:thioesterase II family protein [Raineyella sp.]|uniref:Surfactin synthase thioesterase subunit n=1 Tax=bioreactor metagenome TaxID=1076179 RepID=A0A644XUI8_9ZZZZ|nr:alpha/beta fold hydrolase [Raineyella sp.]MEA5153825.1 alpha/beta fold hydrolase [Raineyella sp.]
MWQHVSDGDPALGTVLMFPATGAGAPAFRSMAALEGERSVWAYCPPGRGRRLLEPGIHDINEFVARVMESLEVPQGPLVVAGVSFGAALAFNVCAALEAEAAGAARLVALCGLSPSSYRQQEEGWDLGSARARMIDYGLTPPAVLEFDEAEDLFVRPTLDDLLLAESYNGTEAAPIAAPIVCVAASDDRLVPLTEADGWRRATTSDFNLIHVDGGHYAHTKFGRWEWLNVLA